MDLISTQVEAPVELGSCEVAMLLFGGALGPPGLGALSQEIARLGLDIVQVFQGNDLSGHIQHCREASRGLTSSPALALLIFDPMPQLDGDRLEGLRNVRVRRGLKVARDFLALPEHAGAKIGVTALEGPPALSLAEQMSPEGLDLHGDLLERLRPFRRTDSLQVLRTGDRSKVELIEWKGRLAVRKTYRPSALGCLARAVDALETLAPYFPELVQLLDKGENFIVVEYVSGGWTSPEGSRRPQPFPLRRVRALADFVQRCLAHGFDPVDLAPGINLIWLNDGFRVFDCEFWRRCNAMAPAHRSACLAGVPASDLEAPRSEWVRAPYRSRWIGFTCLSLRSLLYDPVWLQLIKRPIVYLSLIPGALVARIKQRSGRMARRSGPIAFRRQRSFSGRVTDAYRRDIPVNDTFSRDSKSLSYRETYVVQAGE